MTNESQLFLNEDDDISQESANFLNDDDLAPSTNNKPKKEYTKLESAIKGGLQGATYDSSDEIGAFMGSLMELLPGSASNTDAKLRKQGFTLPESPTYASMRDELRQENKEAQEANPDEYLASQIGAAVLTPANFIPGMAMAKGVKTLGQGVKAATIVGAKQGALQGLGSGEADLTKGDVLGTVGDTIIGGGIGAVAGPVAELGIATAKGLGGLTKKAVTNGLEFLGNAFPDSKIAAQRALEGVNTNVDSFKDATITRFNDIKTRAANFFEGKTKLNAEEEAKLSQEVNGIIEEINKESSDVTSAVSRQRQAEGETKLIEKQKLNVQKEIEAEHKMAKQQAIDDLDTQISQTKTDLKQAEENFKITQNEINKGATQNLEDVAVQNSIKLDEALVNHKSNLGVKYDNINADLTAKGITFNTKELYENAVNLIAGDKGIAPINKDNLLKQIEAVIPENENLTLNEFKDLVKIIKSSGKDDDNLKRVVNKVADDAKQNIYKNIKDPDVLSNLKNTDNDYARVMDLEDYINSTKGDEVGRTFGTIKKLLPKNGIMPGSSQLIQRDINQITSGLKTDSGQQFNDVLGNVLQDVTGANDQKVATKFSKEQLKNSQELQKYQKMIDDLNKLRESSDLPIKTTDQAKAKMAEIGELDKTLAEMEKIRTDNIDVEISKRQNIDTLQQKKMTAEQVLNDYRLSKSNKSAKTLEDELLNKSLYRKEVAVGELLPTALNSQISSKGLDSEGLLKTITDSGITDPKTLKTLAEDLSLYNYSNAPLEGGSLSNRNIIAKTLPKAVNTLVRGGKAVVQLPGKVTKLIAEKTLDYPAKIFNMSGEEVVNKISQSISEKAPVYTKILGEALQKGDPAYKAMLYTLQQQDSDFRKFIKDEIEEKDK